MKQHQQRRQQHRALLLLLAIVAATHAFLLPSQRVQTRRARSCLAASSSSPSAAAGSGAAKREGSSSSSRSSSSSSSAKGAVTLGPYKHGALSDVRVARPRVDEAAAKALVAGWEKQRYTLRPVRFVEEGGTRMGHTVVCDWKATYVKGGDAAKFGLRTGVVLPKADIKGFTLELKEEQPEPLASFARHVATGMGQMETKVFEVEMPATATMEAWRGVTAKIMLLVRSINVKEEVAPDPRSPEEKLAAAKEELMAKAEQQMRTEALAGYRAALLESSTADTDKMESSVSWAKFGENSLKDYKWALIQEAIAEAEGVDFSEVPAFLFSENPVTFEE